MRKLTAIDPELVKIREERKKLRNELDIVTKLIDDKEGKIKDSKEKNQAVREQKTEVREKANEISKEIDDFNEQLRKAYQTKDQMRESYFKQLYEFELQSDKMRYLKGLHNQQKKLRMKKDEKQQRIEKKRIEIQNRPNPYQKEIDTCEHLIGYCTKLKAFHGLVPQTSEEVAKKTEQEMISQYNQQEIDQKLKEGKIILAEKKSEDSFAVNKKGKGKKPKAQKQT